MEIIKAKNAGFCFGVKRAIDMAYDTLEKNTGDKKVYCIGSLIHNEIVTDDLKEKGLVEVCDISILETLKNETVLLRTHGVEKKIKELLIQNGNEVIDLTCPFVSKIQNIVSEYSNKGYKIIVIGDKNHPEVKGIVSYATNDIVVIIDEKDVETIKFDEKDKILVVFQTTTNVKNSKKLVDILRNLFYNIEVVNTICNATLNRQKEVEELSKVVDVMLIIGSKTSSNTKKLYEISKKNLERSYILNAPTDLSDIVIEKDLKIGVSAGASTPEYLIEEILKHAREKF